MILDSTSTRKRTPFYQKGECEKLGLSSAISDRTRVWIGRSSLSGLHADGTDVGIVISDGTKMASGNATTLIVGHLSRTGFCGSRSPGVQGQDHPSTVADNLDPRR